MSRSHQALIIIRIGDRQSGFSGCLDSFTELLSLVATLSDVYVFEPQAHYDQLLRWWYYGLEVPGADGSFRSTFG